RGETDPRLDQGHAEMICCDAVPLPGAPSNPPCSSRPIRTFPPEPSTMRLAALLSLCLLSSPALAADPPVIRSAKSGPWSAAATWDGGTVPGAGARVLIRERHRVEYDVKSDAVIRGISVSGTLAFAPDKDTVLNVGLIKVQPGDEYSEDGFDCDAHAGGQAPGATWLVGTPDHPIAKTAVIRLHYVEGMDRESCPAVVCCGARVGDRR